MVQLLAVGREPTLLVSGLALARGRITPPKCRRSHSRGRAVTPKDGPIGRLLARGIRQAFMYYGVSIMQTFVEFGMFALAQLALPTGVANGIAVACSGSFNFLMNRNITFKASSNFWRSVALFVALYVWNFLFGTWFIGWAAASFGCSEMIGKFATMAMQGIWGFCLCKWVIFR